MNSDYKGLSSPLPARVGVILADLGKFNIAALKYLVLHLNTLQTSFEFEFFSPNSTDPLLISLKRGAIVDRAGCRTMLEDFSARIARQYAEDEEDYDLADRTAPSSFIVISLARFSDAHYVLKHGSVSIQALGNWDRWMAPPSILEFIIVLLMRQASSFLVPSLTKSVHLGTKGCLFDATPVLADARYKSLQPFICSACRAEMSECVEPRLADSLLRVLDLHWLGLPSDPHSPACIVANLGHNLFLTKGIQPTFWESARSVLRNETTKEVIKLIFAILLAALLLRLGLKQ